MTDQQIPPWAEIEIEPPTLQAAVPGASLNDRVMGLRTRLEYARTQARQAQADMARNQAQASARLTQIYLDAIDIADHYDEGLHMARAKYKRSVKQKEVLKLFQTTFEALLHVMETWGLYRVDVLGKTYKTVEFQGQSIPQPWEIINVDGTDGSDGKAKTVVRSLWVYVSGTGVSVFRKAQVTC